MIRKNHYLWALIALFSFSSCKDDDKDETVTKTLNFHASSTDQTGWQLQLGDQRVAPTQIGAFGSEFVVSGELSFNQVTIFKDEKSVTYNLSEGQTYWLYEASTTVFEEAPPLLPSTNEVAVYYDGAGDDLQDWGLHIWDPTRGDWTIWDQPLEFTSPAAPPYGAGVIVPLPPAAGLSGEPLEYDSFPDRLGLIIHKGGEKSVDSDLQIAKNSNGNLLFYRKGDSAAYCSPDFQPCNQEVAIRDAAAHWVSENHLLWNVSPGADDIFELRHSFEPGIRLDPATGTIEGGSVINLEVAELSKDGLPPYIQGLTSLQVAEHSRADLQNILRGQLVAVHKSSNGQVKAATFVQIGRLLDEVFVGEPTLKATMGPNFEDNSINVWAPTAQEMALVVYDRDFNLSERVDMTYDTSTGIWQAALKNDWLANRYFYRFGAKVYHHLTDTIMEYEVTDPYATAVNENAEYSQFVNLADTDLMPAGWQNLNKAPVAPADISIYEAHIRDFSIFTSEAGAAAGKYTAFALNGIDGKKLITPMAHLKDLASSGLTHLQVLPASDFATVNENFDEQVNLTDDFSKLCAATNLAEDLCTLYSGQTILSVYEGLDKNTGSIQEINTALRSLDGFNWGYDPVLFGTPEGSYATKADGTTRVLEFRQMVSGLAEIDLRFSLDVVYNHTNSSGIGPQALLDRLVPGYYHRRDVTTGGVLKSTCCENTATERLMMEKLMIDTLVRWHEDYKVDAFRFDLMGHHLKVNMTKAQEALGNDVFLYGEGWDFGEVAGNQRGINATQLSMAGTGIATFNDRFRDAVRGGGPFDCGYLLTTQGFVNGLLVNPNEFGGLLEANAEAADCTELSDFSPAPRDVQELRQGELADRVRLGLAASLADYSFTNSQGETVKGSEVSYGGSPAGYTKSPQETINYISKHDNQTLWDINQLKLPLATTMEDRKAVQVLGLAMNTFAQGIPFYHMGVEFLRSKSFNRDSFDSGDWFNRIDFTGLNSAWNLGLPRADKDGDNWPLFTAILEKIAEGPTQTMRQETNRDFQKILRERYSSPLYRLDSLEKVQERVVFDQSNATSGLIAMQLKDGCELEDLDSSTDEILILFNVNPKPARFELTGLAEYLARVGFEPESRSADSVTVAKFDTVILTKPNQSSCPAAN